MQRLGAPSGLPLTVSLISAATMVGFGLVVLVADSARVTSALMLALVTATSLLALRATGQPASVPAFFPVAGLGVVGFLGVLLWPSIHGDASVSAVIPFSSDTLVASALLFSAAIGAFASAAAIVYAWTRATEKQASLSDLRPPSLGIDLRPNLMLAAGAASLSCLLLGKGSSIIQSGAYLQASGPGILVSVGNSLTIPSIFLLGIVYYSTDRNTARSWARFLLVFWVIVLFASATRQLAVVPMILLLSRLTAPGTSRTSPIRLLVSTLLSLFAFHLVLQLRGGVTGGYGLVPFSSALMNDPLAFLVLDPGALLGNVLFAAPLTSYVAYDVGSFPLDWLGTSVSPLLGGMTNWPNLIDPLSVNIYTPYNAIGELGNYGWLTLILYFVIAGAVFALCELSTRNLSETLRFMGLLGLMGLSLIFTLDALQYNLRSTTRILYYSVALCVLLRGLTMLGRSTRGSRGTRRMR